MQMESIEQMGMIHNHSSLPFPHINNHTQVSNKQTKLHRRFTRILFPWKETIQELKSFQSMDQPRIWLIESI